jgi:hypothetical protein
MALGVKEQNSVHLNLLLAELMDVLEFGILANKLLLLA